MGLIIWIVFGLVVGIVAKFLMPGRDPGGIFVTIILGIVGAVLGGFMGRALGLYQADEPAGFFMAVLGAIVLLVLYRMVAGRARHA
ncbi:MAG TPA: GlsB/YeaQ/YmgE family stress response membrane protein [Candidatus Limnocylindrales bacterium]|nr:GlsB/YeaQ/YmgE family stress response membrane protein [Candidatus Limnocylindrales bacterium]